MKNRVYIVTRGIQLFISTKRSKRLLLSYSRISCAVYYIFEAILEPLYWIELLKNSVYIHIALTIYFLRFKGKRQADKTFSLKHVHEFQQPVIYPAESSMWKLGSHFASKNQSHGFLVNYFLLQFGWKYSSYNYSVQAPRAEEDGKLLYCQYGIFWLRFPANSYSSYLGRIIVHSGALAYRAVQQDQSSASLRTLLWLSRLLFP